MHRRHSAPRALAPQIQPFLAVDPIRLLVIDDPAFAPHQRVNPFTAVPYTGLSNRPYPFSLSPVITGMRLIVKARRNNHQLLPRVEN